MLFSFPTTWPNAEVAPVLKKAMPVLLLTEEERETWLNGPVKKALELHRPVPDGTLKIVRTREKEDVPTLGKERWTMTKAAHNLH